MRGVHAPLNRIATAVVIIRIVVSIRIIVGVVVVVVIGVAAVAVSVAWPEVAIMEFTAFTAFAAAETTMTESATIMESAGEATTMDTAAFKAATAEPATAH